MVLVPDQYEPNYRKNFDSELLLKQKTKPFFADPKGICGIESNCEEELITSVNDSEEDDPFYEEALNQRKKNVRFGGTNFNFKLETSETSSDDNEYLAMDRGYMKTGHRKILAEEPESVSHKVREHLRVSHKPKCWTMECGYGRPKSSPEKTATFLGDLERRPYTIGEYETHRTKRKDNCCGRPYYGEFDFDEYGCKKPSHRSCRFQYGDDIMSCCDHCPNIEGRRLENKSFVKMKPMATSSHKHKCQLTKDAEPDIKSHRMVRLPQEIHYDSQTHAAGDRYDEYCDITFGSKNKKKVLEVVQEQLEQFSDSTYKIPCSKFSSQTMPGELSEYLGKKSSDKFPKSSHSDWLHYGLKEGSRLCFPKILKMRSRRTRMNKIKSGWKKAFVQTVRDGTRNERVGVIVMGSKGPEFYSKNAAAQFSLKKSKPLLDEGEQNFEKMAANCKNVFLSSSETGPRTNYTVNDLVCPEEDSKVEETIAKFSKNVNDIVKSSDQKFYKSLTSVEYPEKKDVKEAILKGAGDETNEEEEKKKGKADAVDSAFPSFHLLPFEKLSPRVPKSLRKAEKKISEDSKARADALNEAAKQYKEDHSSLQDREETFLEELKELQEKYPSKETKPENSEAELSLWDLSLEMTEKEKEEKKEEECKNDDVKMLEKEKMSKDETSQTGSVKSTEQIILNKQRRKKYYESTTSGTKVEVDGDVENKLSQENHSPKSSKRASKMKKWESSNVSLEDSKQPEDTDPSVISAGFRDLVENGCAISQGESENLQNTFNRVSYDGDLFHNDAMSSTSSEITNLRESKANGTQRTPKKCMDAENKEKSRKDCGEKGKKKEKQKEGDNYLEEIDCKKILKMKNENFDGKLSKKGEGKNREGKKRKKIALEDKMRLLRKALPSIAAQNEAAHLKQLKKYIDRFIDRVEASTSSEYGKRREIYLKSKESTSTDCSEVRVDARKILDFVSNPFKRISSDVTINIAKKLTDALVQDKSLKGTKNYSVHPRKNSENETEAEGFISCGDFSGSELCEEPEPTYLKQLKRMRNEHLNNIVLEVKRLSELLRWRAAVEQWLCSNPVRIKKISQGRSPSYVTGFHSEV